jgi:hypothetical protein
MSVCVATRTGGKVAYRSGLQIEAQLRLRLVCFPDTL